MFTRVNNHLEDLKKMIKEGDKTEEEIGNEENEIEDEKTGFMWKHMKKMHREVLNAMTVENIDEARNHFKFTLTGNFRDPLTRQIMEKVRIRRALKGQTFDREKGHKFQQKIEGCMNSKEESFAPYDQKNKKSRWNRKGK